MPVVNSMMSPRAGSGAAAPTEPAPTGDGDAQPQDSVTGLAADMQGATPLEPQNPPQAVDNADSAHDATPTEPQSAPSTQAVDGEQDDQGDQGDRIDFDPNTPAGKALQRQQMRTADMARQLQTVQEQQQAINEQMGTILQEIRQQGGKATAKQVTDLDTLQAASNQTAGHAQHLADQLPADDGEFVTAGSIRKLVQQFDTLPQRMEAIQREREAAAQANAQQRAAFVQEFQGAEDVPAHLRTAASAIYDAAQAEIAAVTNFDQLPQQTQEMIVDAAYSRAINRVPPPHPPSTTPTTPTPNPVTPTPASNTPRPSGTPKGSPDNSTRPAPPGSTVVRAMGNEPGVAGLAAELQGL